MRCAALFLISVFVFTPVSCSNLKIVPDRIENREISFDENVQNAGIYDYDPAIGWHISEGTAKKYVSLSERYGASLMPPLAKGEGLIIQSEKYYLTNQYMVKFATLNQRHRDRWR